MAILSDAPETHETAIAMSDEEEDGEEEVEDETMDDEDQQYPEIGETCDGHVLVCIGDDRPDRWAPWLEAPVQEFESLVEIAEEFSIGLQASAKGPVFRNWRDFCEAAGVSFGCRFWDGDHISGHLIMGWIQKRSVQRVKRATESLLGSVRRQLNRLVRGSTLKELCALDDVEEFIERTRNDRRALRSRCEALETTVRGAQRTIEALEQTVQRLKRGDTTALTGNCLLLAGAVLRGTKSPTVAGPLALWTDGVVYALVNRGGIQMPEDSAPWKLMRDLEESGHQIVQVTEMTVLGGWISGPIYRRGTADIAGWTTAWQDQEAKPRRFVVQPAERLAVVEQIHAHFKGHSPQSPAD